MTPAPLFPEKTATPPVSGFVCGRHGCTPITKVVRRHIPPGIRHRANVVAAAAAKSKPPPKEPMPEIPTSDLAETVAIVRRRAPHCFLCRMIVRNMVGSELHPEKGAETGEELFSIRGQILHALDELEMARHPEWVAAQKAAGTY